MIINARLNPKVKTKWLAALRGRKFKQGTGQLCNPVSHQYCCLGVLANVTGLDKVIDMEKSYLPRDEAAHLFHCNHSVATKIQAHLSTRNDGGNDWDNLGDRERPENFKPQKFYQIARWIDRNL